MPRVLGITTRISAVVALTGLTACSPSGGGVLLPGLDPGAGVAVTLSPTSATIEVGQTLQMIATLSDGVGAEVPGDVSWTSSNNSVASVNDAGLVAGVAVGAATITATAGTLSRNATVTVVDPPAPSGSLGISSAPMPGFRNGFRIGGVDPAGLMPCSVRCGMGKAVDDALDFLDEGRPDLILRDLMMSVMDGFEFLETVSQREA